VQDRDVRLLLEVTNGEGKCKLSLISNHSSTVIKAADLGGSEIEVRATSFQVDYKVSSLYLGEPIPLEICSDSSLLVQEGAKSSVVRPGCTYLTYASDKMITIAHLKV